MADTTTTTCLASMSKGEIKKIAHFLTECFKRDHVTKWMFCNDEAMLANIFPQMVLMDLSAEGEDSSSIFVTRMYDSQDGNKENGNSKELVAVGVWRKTMEHMEESDKNMTMEINEGKRSGKNILFYERHQLIIEKFHKVKFDIFPIMKYDKPIVYISWIGTLKPFEKYSNTIINEIFTKSEADSEELICMLGSNVQDEQCYKMIGFKTINHVVLSDTDIENIDVIYDTIGGETEKLVEQDVELFTMIREPHIPDIPFLQFPR